MPKLVYSLFFSNAMCDIANATSIFNSKVDFSIKMNYSFNFDAKGHLNQKNYRLWPAIYIWQLSVSTVGSAGRYLFKSGTKCNDLSARGYKQISIEPNKFCPKLKILRKSFQNRLPSAESCKYYITNS